MEHQYAKYPFSLDSFQKKAIKGIEEENHVLVCAPTGSGKSLVAQHTVDWGLRQKKRVIYTTPIKSLSNQAYASLAKHFGPDNVGIMTGDTQYNPGAPVLIMTTEILRNFLIDGRTRRHTDSSESVEDEDEDDTMYWSMDVSDSVSAVVFDEVHYIQDPHRGHVWETCFVKMPRHISMVMLSATIENPQTLVSWLESIHTKPVILCQHDTRAVPLSHCLFTHLNPTSKQLPDPNLKRYRNALVDVTQWSEPELERYMKPIRDSYDWFQKGGTAIEGCVHYLKEHDMLPTLCFVLSRKRCESMCETWTVGLLNRDEVALIHRDWKRLVRDACRGDKVMLAKIEGLPQYRKQTEALMKGVAFHHSGVVPILKECVEMLMKDGRVPCVFATETFAVGINSPTRTVIMSQIDKRTEGGVRCLQSHEYTQMGGRAGRRGLDTVGFVVSLPISFVKKTSALQWYRMVHGSPVHISATRVIPIESVLRSLKSTSMSTSTSTSSTTKGLSHAELLNVVGTQSMRAYEIDSATSQIENTTKSSSVSEMTEEEQSVWDRFDTINRRVAKTQGQRKRKEKKLKEFYSSVDSVVWESVKKKRESYESVVSANSIEEERRAELDTTLHFRLRFLQDAGYVQVQKDDTYLLTRLGQIAVRMSQGNSLYTAYILHTMGEHMEQMKDMDVIQLLCQMSLFRGDCIEEEETSRDITSTTRSIVGESWIREMQQHSMGWDRVAQTNHSWEPSTLYKDMVEPLERLREYPESEWDYFLLQRMTGWQEGTLWKSMNDIVAMAGEWMEAFGIMSHIGMYKKCRDAQVVAKRLTIMIPSLYLQQTSLSLVPNREDELESSETGQDVS